MFSHVMVGADDLETSKAFYEAIFAALGGKPGVSDPKGRTSWLHKGAVFMLTKPIDGEPASCGNGMTIGFQCDSAEMVHAWHEAGVAAGGTAIEDPPGIRQNPFGQLYLAYLRDPAGNKLCGLYREPRK
ncbi:VOC family protein [Sphingomicrobium aestuariivivum]|uniref:VOC family protein n=1 Tax=Sphingomicrobium aestuariivivum TaxID=1582356 RepID=UPI001FD6D0E1|nr:VOC family protein [Sphingomicrobium aestuariivivum]MCJ8191496.1 VOC family protein [Sphingomicrobium aestuariivivum]